MAVNRTSGPPDGGYGWVVLACCACCLCTIFGLFKIMGLVLVELIDIYKINRTEAFLVIIIYRLFGFVFAPVIGKLLTKFDYSVILGLGSLLISVSLIFMSLTTAYWQVVITYGCIQGLGVNCIMSASAMTIGVYFNKRRSLAMGIMYAIAGASGFISPLIFNWLLQTYYFNGAMLIMGGLGLNSCALSMLVRQPTWTHHKKPKPNEEGRGLLKLSTKYSDDDSKSSQPKPDSDEVSEVKAPNCKFDSVNMQNSEEKMKELSLPLTQVVQPKQPKDSSLVALLREIRRDLQLFKDGHFLLQLINQFLTSMPVSYFLAIVPDFAEGEMTSVVTRQEVAFVLSMSSIGDIICQLGTGFFLDKLPWPKKHTLGGLSVCIGVTVLAFQFAQVYAYLVIGSVIFGLCMGMLLVVQVLVEIELIGPQRVHVANGLTRFFVGSAKVVTGVLIGYLRDRLGSYKVCLAFLGGCGILGGLVWVAEPLVVRCFPPQLQQEKTKEQNMS